MSEKCILNFVEKISKYCMFLVLINVCKSFELLFCVIFSISATEYDYSLGMITARFFFLRIKIDIKKKTCV